MNKIIIEGGNTIEGEVYISSSKNSALTIMAAALLPRNNESVIINNLPSLSDVYALAETIRDLGVNCVFKNNTLEISGTITNNMPDEVLIKKTRASSLLIAPLVIVFSEINMPFPGGCSIGPRPLDLHLFALEQMGVSIENTEQGLKLKRTQRLKGCTISFPQISVGATANILMCAVCAEGRTIIRNAALEPEIHELCAFLNKSGAKIQVLNNRVLYIEGVNTLRGCDFTLMPDRIEAATYAIAAAITHGTITLRNIKREHLSLVLNTLKKITLCDIFSFSNTEITIKTPSILPNPITLTTAPYPGFPTDIQAPFMALLSLSSGFSKVIDQVFPERFKHAYELNKLGARIKVNRGVATIEGVKELYGTTVQAPDLRGGIALVLAGLVAKGNTVIENTFYIDRGYEDLVKKLTNCNAKLWRE